MKADLTLISWELEVYYSNFLVFKVAPQRSQKNNPSM